MVHFVEMDANITLFDQMEQRVDPVILLKTLRGNQMRPTSCFWRGRLMLSS